MPKRATPTPDDGEDRDTFMDRCVSQVMDEDGLSDADAQAACEIAWDESGPGEAAHRAPVVKSTIGPVRNFQFTLSDETVDRYGDVVSAGGWELDNFRRNPVALFGHQYDFPIGRWQDLHVEDKALRGKLILAPKGTSARIDEISTLIEHDILRAVSVGFRPTATPQPLKDAKGEETGGVRFVRQELLECSVVPIPANPNALSIARALNISSDTLRLVFAEPGNARPREMRRDIIGEPAALPTRRKDMPSNFSDRIESIQSRIVMLEDRRDEHLRNVDDLNPSDADDTTTNDLNRQINQLVRHLGTLKEAEQARGPGGSETSATRTEADPPPARGRELVPVRPGRANASTGEIAFRQADGRMKFRNPPAIIKRRKELDAVDYIVRNGVIMLLAHRLRKSVDEARAIAYGDDENTKVLFNAVQKAATAPAMTDVPGWAAELVTQVQGDFMFPLMPDAVFPRLSAMGLSLDFGRAGRIAIPTRSRTTTIAGAFVGEGQPIPVRQGLFAAQIITPKKLGVITVMTREIEEHSIPAIEALLRQAISEDTGESIDNVLLDANPATTVRPAGIRNAMPVPLPATVNAAEPVAFDRMLRDFRRIKADLIGKTNNNVRAPVWIMNPIRSDAIALCATPGTGLFPFKADVEGGTLLRWPIIESTTLGPDEIIAVDAADFVTAGQGAPTFEVSDQAVLHMEDTDPGPIHGPQPPDGTTIGPATPVRSLWQTDSYALRLLYRVNWMLRRPMVAWMQGFQWGSLSALTPVLAEGNGNGQAYQAEPNYQQ